MPAARKFVFKPTYLILFVFAVFALVFFALSPSANFNPRWEEKPRQVSRDGVLDVTLDAKKSSVEIAGKQVDSPVYNGTYLGDTWEIRGGDTVRVHLSNGLDTPTNLHFHGSHVSPKGNSDNVILSVKPGENFEYEYNLPETHPPGLYWYHPHLHPDVEAQVLGGMAGAIIVRGDIDELPGIKGVPEKLLVLTTQDGNNQPTYMVNGRQNPTMYLRPGETTRLRVLNASADDFVNFAIPGHKLYVISRDGNTLSEVEAVDTELLAPGNRTEFLFTPEKYGNLAVKTMKYDQGFFTYTEADLMNIKVQGLPMIPHPLPTALLPHEDLRHAEIDNTRTLTFSEGGTDDNPTFLLDGKVVNMDRVDQFITLGTTEEWHLVNKSGETHPFHIHINPFQVISINGEEVDQHGYRDTIGIPANGEVVMRTRYTDFDGKFVLHCHILFHEDHGMMQVVEIVKPGADPAPHNGAPGREMTQKDMLMHMKEAAKIEKPERLRDFR